MKPGICRCGYVFRGSECPPGDECHDCTHDRAEAAEAERDELRAELAAVRGEAAPDPGWCHDAEFGGWRRLVGGLRCMVARNGAWAVYSFVARVAHGTADRLTGPDGAFAQAERAVGLADEGGPHG